MIKKLISVLSAEKVNYDAKSFAAAPARNIL